VSISRSVTLPRNAVGATPPREQPYVCLVPLGLLILEQAIFRVAEPHNRAYVAEPLKQNSE